MAIAGTTDDVETTEDKHKKDDDTGGGVDVGEDVVDKISGISVGVVSRATLKKKFIPEIKTGHIIKS